jgi:hypothetical protein
MLWPSRRRRARVARTVSTQPQATGAHATVAPLGRNCSTSRASMRDAVARPAGFTEFHVAAKFLCLRNVSNWL